MRELEEVHVQIGDAVIARVATQRLLRRRCELLLADVRRVADDRIEPIPRERERVARAEVRRRHRSARECFDHRARRRDSRRIDVGTEHAVLRDEARCIAATVRRGKEPHDLDEERTFADREVAHAQREDRVA